MKYAVLSNPATAPQSAPRDGRQVKNAAGGYVYRPGSLGPAGPVPDPRVGRPHLLRDRPRPDDAEPREPRRLLRPEPDAHRGDDRAGLRGRPRPEERPGAVRPGRRGEPRRPGRPDRGAGGGPAGLPDGVAPVRVRQRRHVARPRLGAGVEAGRRRLVRGEGRRRPRLPGREVPLAVRVRSLPARAAGPPGPGGRRVPQRPVPLAGERLGPRRIDAAGRGSSALGGRWRRARRRVWCR